MDDVHQVPVEAEGDLAAVQVRAEPQPGPARPVMPSLSTMRSTSITAPAGSACRGGEGWRARWWGSGRAGRRASVSSWRSSAFRFDGTVLTSSPSMSDVDAVLVGPDVRGLAGAGRAQS